MKPSFATQQLRDAIRLRHLSHNTEECYCGWLARFMEFARAFPEQTSEQKFEGFLTMLARKGVSASTQSQAFNAVLFFYRHVLQKELARVDALRAKRPIQVRVAPSVEDVRALLTSVDDLHGYPTRLLTHLLYGCGMRVGEPIALRTKDVLIADSRLVLRGAKGGKDRVVPIPCSLIEPLRRQLRAARVVWEQDAADGIEAPLPGLLGRKYPRAGLSWGWAWVFPSRTRCQHPRTGQTVRWHCHPANIQRAVKAAARPLGLDITPHHLRHAYATHALRAGASVRDLQDALGHSQINTTMGYLTPQACAVPSPLESIAV